MMADSNSTASKRSLTSSSMVGLKAELHRKQEEFRRQRVDHGQNVKGRKVEKIKTKKNIWSQQNRGISERAIKDVEEKVEEENDLEKSRKMLAHKSRLYDEMSSTSTVPDDDGSEGFLVDFQRKAVDRIVEEREKQRNTEEEKREEEAEAKALAEPVPNPADSDEEWVDFTDSLGRSRRCMKKDLGKMKKKDDEYSGHIKTKVAREKEEVTSPQECSGSKLPDLMSSDMHREKMRQKWEEETQVLLDKGQEDIHYSNIQFDETRTHGVGYFQFSKDHVTREDQLDELKKLRDETVNETSRKDRIQAKRKSLMEARLAKVRDRRKLKGVSDNKIQDEKAEAESALAAAKLKEEEDERKRKEEAEKEAEEVRRNHLREWDKDKLKNSWAGMGYVQSKRKEREAEFAPPSVYFEQSRTNTETKSDQGRINRLKQFTQNRDLNPDFAPPSFYHSQERKTEHNKPEKSNPSSFNSASHSSKEESQEKSELNSSSSLNENNPFPASSDKSCPLPTSSDKSYPLPTSSNAVDAVGSIPLPDDNDNLSNRSESTFTGGASTVEKNTFLSGSQSNSNQHYVETHQRLDDWYHYQLPGSQHQHQHYNQQAQQQFQNEGTTSAQLGQYYMQGYQSQPPPQHQPPHPPLEFLQPPQQPPQQPVQLQQLPQQQPTQQQQPVQLQQQPMQQQQPPQPAKRCYPDKTTGNKPKMPKSSIMDTRFMQNLQTTTQQDFNLSSTDTNLLSISAVAYQPGSFTAARFPQGKSTNEPSGESNTTTQIAGGPQLYSQLQLEEQQRQLDETDMKDDDMADQKLNDFLASIRNETS